MERNNPATSPAPTSQPNRLALHRPIAAWPNETCCVLQPAAAAAELLGTKMRILAAAMSRHCVAACFARRREVAPSLVCVWDLQTRRLLRTVSLPSRQHVHFHPNVIIQNSLTAFGFHIALDDFRIALSAQCKQGDWREEVDGWPFHATSLLVVQEFGPDWCQRNKEGATGLGGSYSTDVLSL